MRRLALTCAIFALALVVLTTPASAERVGCEPSTVIVAENESLPNVTLEICDAIVQGNNTVVGVGVGHTNTVYLVEGHVNPFNVMHEIGHAVWGWGHDGHMLGEQCQLHPKNVLVAESYAGFEVIDWSDPSTQARFADRNWSAERWGYAMNRTANGCEDIYYVASYGTDDRFFNEHAVDETGSRMGFWLVSATKQFDRPTHPLT